MTVECEICHSLTQIREGEEPTAVCDHCAQEFFATNKKLALGAPTDFVDLMADWMIEYGPDGHCDGHEKIAQLAWEYILAQFKK